MSKKHLQKYLDEYSFRYNNKSSEFYYSLNKLLNNTKKLTYKELIK